MTRPAQIATALTTARQLDKDWMRRVPETDRARAPWMPFPSVAFLAMLLEALPEVPGITGDRTPRMLMVGCGPGPKMILAREVAGLEVTGIDVVAEYIKQAADYGLDARLADALEFTGYGEFDLIWFNRVFRDPGRQQVLERMVWNAMAPGAVVMCANLEAPPPSSWWIVLDDWEIRRGIWSKPAHLTPARHYP